MGSKKRFSPNKNHRRLNRLLPNSIMKREILAFLTGITGLAILLIAAFYPQLAGAL
jgi:hypothetical protein